MNNKLVVSLHYFLLYSSMVFLALNTLSAQSSNLVGGAGWLIAQGEISSTTSNVAALYANPAGLISADSKWGLDIGFKRNFNISDLDTYSAGAFYSISGSTIGVSYVRYGNEFLSEQKISLDYARSLFSKLDIGARFNYHQLRQSEFMNVSALTFELGVSSEVSKTVDFGAYVTNPLSQKLNDLYRLPTFISFGIDYHPSSKVSLKGELAKSIKDPITVRLGIKYAPVERVTFLLGSDIGARQVGIGVRLNLGAFTVNGGYGINQVLNNTPALSFSFQQ